MSDEHQIQPEAQQVVVYNPEARIVQLTAYVKDAPHEEAPQGIHQFPRAKKVQIEKFLPGLNLTDAARLQAVGFQNTGALRVVNPCEVNPWQAKEWIRNTTSRKTLLWWRIMDPRLEIKTEIDRVLNERAFRARGRQESEDN